mgnify:CR=1 FL=1
MKFSDTNPPKYRIDYVKHPKDCIEYWMNYYDKQPKQKKSVFERMKKWMSLS